MLLHLITTAGWRAALAEGAVRPGGAGFVHLSTPEQVTLPARHLFAGRPDVVALVVDPGRVPAEIRWEPGRPEDPPSMRFPHAYGPVPTAAVLAVLPYREPLALPELDAATRVTTLEGSVPRRAATTEVPVTGGVAVRTPAFPASYQHNCLIVDGPTDLPTLLADADRALAGLPHRQVTLLGAQHAALAAELGTGRQVTALAVMVAPAGASPARSGAATVERLDRAALRPLREAVWRRDLPDLDEEEYRQLLDRDALTDAVTDVRRLAVRDGAGSPIVAGADLLVDGATAYLDAVQTLTTHRGHGHGDALVSEALAQAGEAGCDLVGLTADLADWPRHWYARRGFVEVGRAWSITWPARS